MVGNGPGGLMTNAIKLAIHGAAAFLAYVLAYSLVLSTPPGGWFGTDGRALLALAGFYALLALGLEAVFRIDRATWRYVSIDDAADLARSTLLTAGAFLAIVFVTNRADAIPRSVLILTWIIHFGSLVGLRLLRRLAYERSLLKTFAPRLGCRPAAGRPILLVGRLDVAESFLRELARDPRPTYHPLGILGSDRADVGRIIRGVAVIGTVDDLEHRAQACLGRSPGLKSILFLSPPDIVQDIASEALGRLKAAGVALLRLPAVHEISSARATLPSALRELSVEELLSRPAVQLDLESIHELVNGRRVLVTGAGGSIGSELCRQVAAFGCVHLSMLDHSEFGLFKIEQEIGVAYPGLARKDLICDVRDRDRVLACMQAAAPDIVFHAAALKHVPIVENHPAEGVLTNVVGVWNVATAARAVEAARMVLVSTDKAVDPQNVMGATKRLAEAVVRGQHGRSRTKFSVVRFGNVLGSAGSVAPTFQAQIERGGPITVTHPDVERYFMTIPEAVQLVLHATAESAGRDLSQPSVFVLEMGEPVKIVDLARTMITLHGLAAERDIEIVFTGLRRGEKLTETLIDSNERVLARMGSVIEVVAHDAASAVAAHHVRQLEGVARSGDDEATLRLVFQHVARLRGVQNQRIAG